MKKFSFFCSLLILVTGILIKVQANEDAQLSPRDRFIIQLKKTCHYDDNTIPVDNKNIQVLIINRNIFDNNYTYDKYESNNKNEIIFNNVKFKDKDKIKFINIRLYNSKKEAIEALFANLAGYQSICSHQTQVRLLEKDNGFEYGDYAVCVDDRALSFSRANACYYIYSPKGPIDNSYHDLFKSLDELCCKQIQTENVDNNRLAIIITPQSNDLSTMRRETLSQKLKNELQFKVLNDKPDRIVSKLHINDETMQKISPEYLIDIRYKNDNFVDFIIAEKSKEYKCRVLLAVLKSNESAIDNIYSLLSSHLAMRSAVAGTAIQIRQNEKYHLGECCGFAMDDYYLFCRANVAVVIFARFKELSEIYTVGKVLDEHIKDSLVPIEDNMPVPSLVFESSKIMKHEPKTTYKRKNGDDEKLEQELKSMSKEDAQKHCLEKALALSETPDDKPEELMLYLRGLPMPETDGTAKILHSIGANSKDAKLLSAAAQMQGKWLSGNSETSRSFIGDLANALKSDDAALRRRAIESLGRSGSLDALPILLKELESRPGDQDVAAAVGRVLGQKSSRGAIDDGRSKELNNAAADFLRSLETLRKFYDAK